MKVTKLLFVCSVSYGAMITAAHADPISLALGTAIFQGLYTIGIPGAIANFVAVNGLGLAIAGASIVSGLAARSGAVNASEVKNTFSSSESPAYFGIGRGRIGGLKVFGNTDGSTRWRVVARVQGPIDAVEEYYVGNREVIVESNGFVSSPPWVKSDGTSWIKIQDKAGTGSDTAWSALISAFPTLWSSEHRLRGIAQSLVTYFNPGLESPLYLKLYQGGVAETEWVARMARVYDASDESQGAASPATWKWSENAVWTALHVLRFDPVWYPAALYDWERMIATAAACDALVSKRGGTEKRARLWGIGSFEGARGDTLKDVLDSAGLDFRISDEGKVYFELVDDDPEPELALSDLDIVEDNWQGGPEAVERPNICRVWYYSPERDYELAEIDMSGIGWARIDAEVDVYGPKYLDVKLPFCPSAAQAQRIARRKFAMERADVQVLTTNMVGIACFGKRYCTVLTELDDGPVKTSIESVKLDDGQGTCELSLKVWPSLTPWAPGTDEALPPDEIPALNYTSDTPTPAAPTSMLQITYPGGGKELRIAYAITDPYDVIEASFRTYADGLPGSWSGMTEVETTFAWVTGNYLGLVAVSRVRIFDNDEASDFSEIFSTTIGVDNATPAAPVLVSGGAATGTLDVVVRATQLRVAAIRLQREVSAGVWTTISTQNCRPNQELSFTNGGGSSETWRIFCLTSDGTTGPSLTFVYVDPD